VKERRKKKRAKKEKCERKWTIPLLLVFFGGREGGAAEQPFGATHHPAKHAQRVNFVPFIQHHAVPVKGVSKGCEQTMSDQQPTQHQQQEARTRRRREDQKKSASSGLVALADFVRMFPPLKSL
jgi:hypothetical protein